MQGQFPFFSSKPEMTRTGLRDVVPTCIWILVEGEEFLER